jgi:hypothetical protein
VTLAVLETSYRRFVLVDQPDCRVICSSAKRSVIEGLLIDIEKRKQNQVVIAIKEAKP